MPVELRSTTLAASLLIAALFSAIGCGKPKDKVLVTGNVTWESQPLPAGDITFFLAKQVPAGAGKIEHGKYEFLSKPGAMRVEILASRDTGKVDPTEKSLPRQQYIPARYNRKSELTAEVKLEDENKFDFSLTP